MNWLKQKQYMEMITFLAGLFNARRHRVICAPRIAAHKPLPRATGNTHRAIN